MNLNTHKLFSLGVLMAATLVIAATVLVSNNVLLLFGNAVALNQTSSLSSSSSPMPPINNRTLSTANMTTALQSARDQYLSIWNRTAFNASFSTFAVPNSTLGYGVYREHNNIFKPGETILLYVEPVGFKFKPIVDSNGNNLHLINMTANFVLAGSNGTIFQTINNVPVGSIISHRENTELYLDLTLTQVKPFPLGTYNITYNVTDQASGQSFKIEKQIVVANATASSFSPLSSSPR